MRQQSAHPSPSADGPGLVVRELDDLARALLELRSRAGNLSYADIARRVSVLRCARGDRHSARHPGKVTVYDCFRLGRKRLDIDLVADIVTVLDGVGAVAQWRSAYAELTCAGPPLRAGVVRPSMPEPAVDFVGRAAELDALLHSPAPLLVIVGPAGVGKTDLALEAASRLSGGHARHVFVSLNGFDPALPPADWRSVLAGIVSVLQPHGVRCARNVAAQSALVTQELAAASTLVVLDNVRDLGQVEPLLPVLAGARVVVTSRNRWVGSDAAELVLGPLPLEDAVRLLVGDDEATTGPEERRELELIAEICDRLPLPLSVAAAALRDNPDWSPRDHRIRLEAAPEDESVRRSVSLSFDDCEPSLERALYMAALHPGGEQSLAAAAALMGLDPPAATDMLARLEAASLVRVSADDTVRMHDVIREEVRRRGRDRDPASVVHAAESRLLHHYSVVAADRVRDVFGPGLVAPAVAGAAQRWLRTEVDGALALAVERAQQERYDAVAAIEHTWSMWLEYTRRARDAELLLTLALRNPDPAARRTAALRLARLQAKAGKAPEALSWAHHAVCLEPDEPEGLNHLYFAMRQAGQLRQGFTHLVRAQALTRERGDELWEGRLACNLASAMFDLGRWADVTRHERAAADISERVGDNPCRAYVLQGRLYRAAQLGRWEEFDAVMAELVSFSETTGVLPEPSAYRVMQARSFLGRGRNAEATALLDLNGDESPAGLFEVAAVRLKIALDEQDAAAAAAELREIDDLCRLMASPYYELEAAWLRGISALSLREPQPAGEHFRTSMQIADDMGMALDVARAHCSLVYCLDPARHRDRVQRHVRAARRIMRGSGADLPGDVGLLERWHGPLAVPAGGG